MTDAKSERERHMAAWGTYFAGATHLTDFEKSMKLEMLEDMSLVGLRKESKWMGFDVHV